MSAGSSGNFGLVFSFSRIVNGISGRTNKLEQNVENDKKNAEIENLLNKFSVSLESESIGVPKHRIYDFLYYCQMDGNFPNILQSESDLVILSFLKKKAKSYLQDKETNNSKN